MSGATEVVTGYPASAFFADQRFWSDRIHPADRDRVFELYEEAVRTGRDYGFEYRFRSSDDRICWMRGNAQALRRDVASATGARRLRRH
ncbi:MAG: PAS domain-containing protein [Actinobacteria bacterium]|nr:PAS domain-containing protein [Actinomycetota bacterium]